MLLSTAGLPVSRRSSGPLLTLLLIAAIEGGTRAGIVDFANPVVLLLIPIVFAGYRGGIQSAALSTGFALAYGTYFFATPGTLAEYSYENGIRVLTLWVLAPFLAWMTGTLKDQGERLLTGQLERERAHVAQLEEAERSLLASEAQLRSVLDALPAAVVYVDRDLRIRLHNPLYEQWTRVAPDKISGAHLASVLGPERFETELRPKVERVFAGERVVWESERLDRNGRAALAEVAMVPHKVGDEVLGYFGMLFDITERKAIEKRLSSARERLQRALEGSRLALWEVDVAAGEVSLSEEWRDIVGREASTRLRLGELRSRVHPEEMERVDAAFQALLAGRSAHYDLEHRVRAEDGAWRWIHSAGRVSERDAAGRPLRIVGTNRDVSERKHAEETRDRFVSMVSHELRTPLTSILGVLETLVDGEGGSLPAEAAKLCGVALRNAERMLALADEILEIERIDQGYLKLAAAEIDLAEVLKRARELSEGYARRSGIALGLGSLERAAVYADAERILQVVTNFVSNAVKHSPRGGTVQLELRLEAGRARVTVSDQGRGIPQEFAARLFGRFEQSSAGRQQGGIGLGLAICKEIVERSGGRIGYQPGPRGGAEFYFELPLISPGPAALSA